MRIIAVPEILSGFLCDAPFADLPALTHCGEAQATPGFELPLHHHAGFEFLYLVRGSADWIVAGKPVSQGMGDLLITLPGEPHRSAHKFRSDMYNFWIGLDLGKLGDRGAHMAGLLRRNKIRLLHRCHAIEPVLRALVGAVVTPLPRQRQVICAYLNVLLELIEQRQEVEASPPDERAPVPYSYMAQKVISYMKRNLDRRLSLSDLAHVANVRNSSYLCQRFGHEVGATPAAFHLQLRLEAARDGLAQPSMDITSAATQYGFSSSQHFSALFRRAFGATPSAWKKGLQVAARKKAPIEKRARNRARRPA